MTDRRDKLWGGSRTLYRGVDMIVDLADGRAGGASSLHLHRHMDNFFLVLRGALDIYVGESLYRRLAAGAATMIPAGTRHRMVFVTPAMLVEVYTPVSGGPFCDPGDIVRFDEGRPGVKGGASGPPTAQ